MHEHENVHAHYFGQIDGAACKPAAASYIVESSWAHTHTHTSFPLAHLPSMEAEIHIINIFTIKHVATDLPVRCQEEDQIKRSLPFSCFTVDT